MEEWNNNAALGYAMMAAQAIGLDQTDTEALLASMRELFDQIDVDTAAARYEQSEY